MSKLIKIIVLVVIVGAIGGFIYWQFNKNKIVRDAFTDTISNKSDSLYFLQYDSSAIDEINGNASFYNVVLQSDEAQKALLSSTDSLPNALYNIRITEVSAKGIDIPGLMQQRNVKAATITLLKPVIQIINTGEDKPKQFTMRDTLELYQKILGKFKSIKADTIKVVNGTLLMTNKSGKPQTTMENINISLNNFLVDSTKDYESIVSYFIKDVRATVENIQLPESGNNTRLNFEKVDYNAAKRYLHIGAVRQYEVNNMEPFIDLQNITINELNTDAFILQQKLRAGIITCDGGLITIYTKKKQGEGNKGDQSIELASDIIDQAQIGGLDLKSTKIVVLNKDEPAKPPFILRNASLKVTRVVNITEGTTINNLINNAEWQLSANGFTFISKDKEYELGVGNFSINSAAARIKISNFFVKPLLSEKQFVKQMPFQKDQYNLEIKDISLSGVNIKRLLTRQELEINAASLQPAIKIFNDRNMKPDGTSKVGKYPHQSLLKLDLPIYIKSLKVTNGSVSYRERALKSDLIGNVFFNGINATVSNITNMPTRIKANPVMELTARARFLGAGNINTTWRFPLTSSKGEFHINGNLAGMNAMKLNPIIEPLAMASIKEGNIDGVTFDIRGMDTKSTASVLFLYTGLKMELLKKGNEEELKKKGLLSFFANTIIKNDNKSSSNVKEIEYERDITKSFFNLVWKTIFQGAKNTALGKK